MSGENPGKKFGPFTVAKLLYLNEGGIFSFYKGLDAALMRQVFYGTTRFGVFLNLQEYVQRKNNGKMTFLEKGVCSLMAGASASMISTPTDLILVRL